MTGSWALAAFSADTQAGPQHRSMISWIDKQLASTMAACAPLDASQPMPCPPGYHAAAGLPEGQAQEPEILLGHYCAILTSLSLSANGSLLATTDRCSLGWLATGDGVAMRQVQAA